MPETLITDQGSAFVAKLFMEEVKNIGTKVNYVTPYHHQANGLVERWNQTLVSMLKPLMELCPLEWENYLNPVMFAYRTTIHSSTGDTPFF